MKYRVAILEDHAGRIERWLWEFGGPAKVTAIFNEEMMLEKLQPMLDGQLRFDVIVISQDILDESINGAIWFPRLVEKFWDIILVCTKKGPAPSQTTANLRYREDEQVPKFVLTCLGIQPTQ